MKSHDVEPIAVIVINWNGGRYLARCLEALELQTAPVHTVVVDNGSTDGSLEYLESRDPAVELIALGENRGYAGGANAGLRATRCEYAVILNPDVVLAPDHLAILAARLDAEPSVGAAQGRLYQVRPDDYLAGRFESGAPLDSAAIARGARGWSTTGGRASRRGTATESTSRCSPRAAPRSSCAARCSRSCHRTASTGLREDVMPGRWVIATRRMGRAWQLIVGLKRGRSADRNRARGARDLPRSLRPWRDWD